MKRFLQPWLLITVGIIMNIASAIVTHYFINQNNRHIGEIQQEITNIDANIDKLWQAKTEMERKKEFILLLLNNVTSQPLNPIIEHDLKQQLSKLKTQYIADKSHVQTLSIESTLSITAESQQQIIKDINNQYFKQLELQASVTPLMESNALLYSIAIFMQLIGLILVLSRDLARQ